MVMVMVMVVVLVPVIALVIVVVIVRVIVRVVPETSWMETGLKLQQSVRFVKASFQV